MTALNNNYCTCLSLFHTALSLFLSHEICNKCWYYFMCPYLLLKHRRKNGFQYPSMNYIPHFYVVICLIPDIFTAIQQSQPMETRPKQSIRHAKQSCYNTKDNKYYSQYCAATPVWRYRRHHQTGIVDLNTRRSRIGRHRSAMCDVVTSQGSFKFRRQGQRTPYIYDGMWKLRG